MGRLAIIPARGGSKRIPRKNVKIFRDRPIIAIAIRNAMDSGLFETVMVSTDDEEIAGIAKEYGAEVPFLRTDAASSDVATTADVLIEVLERYREMGREFGFTCCIYPTSPLLQIKTLKEGFRLLEAKGYDSVLPVVSFSYPILRSLSVDQDSRRIRFNWPEYVNTRSQDLEPAYHDAGQFYWLKTEPFLRDKALIGDNTGALILNEMEVQDIDTETDWKLAEIKYERLQGTK